MTHDNLSRSISEYIKAIPSLPTSAGKVLEICNSTHVNPADLNHVISLDPVLVGRLLNLLNSAYYGLGSHISSLARAIIMLGINTVKNLTLSTAILGTLPINKDRKGLDMEGFWQHSLCVGIVARLLAKKQGTDSKFIEDYFTAGLLHDIGKIPLNAALSADYLLVVTDAEQEQKPLVNQESKILGVNHCEAGAMIAEAWKLEGPVADAIGYHHSLDRYSGSNAGILYNVAIADYFSSSNEIGFAGNRYPEKPESKIWDVSGVRESDFEKLKEMVNSEIEKAKIFLKVADHI
ncbi:MAG: HDOD domain-containing protein [Treponema sp.]|jgi:putative nucleotidyltransferase with HDIG domain|nr:HDOD domain-containing protein [Treponema sp.]